MENYFQTYVNRDVRRLFPKLQFETYKRFIKMIAFSSGQLINISNFARSLDVSQPTVKSYFEIAEGTFLWRNIPSYEKSMGKRIVKMPKGHLCDTGLINYLLNIKTVDDLKSHPHYGYIWEIFVIEQIIKNLAANMTHCNFYHYRTSNQAEIDLILETGTGLIPIEIKTGSAINGKQLVTIKNFVPNFNCLIGIVINNGDKVIRLAEKILQVPAKFL